LLINLLQQIVGAEAISYTTPFEPTWVIDHCRELRKIDSLKNAHFVIGIESNGNGTERQHQTWHIEGARLRKTTVLKESGGSKSKKLPGIVTTDIMKETMSRKLKDDLDYGRVCFHSQFVTKFSGPKVTPSMMKEKILQQLSGFKRITIPNSQEYKKDKVIYTGKMHGGIDDLVMGLFLSMYSGVLYQENLEKYRAEMIL